MAGDHFQKHNTFSGKVDWNFNLVFDDQPQVTKLAAQYAPLLDHPGLYPVVPNKWLHATVLRIGLLEEYTGEEMREVAKTVKSRISNLYIPELKLGQWWLWGGNVVLHIMPEDPLQELFDLVVSSLKSVVGKDRIPVVSKFIPHITIAYCRSYNDELEIYQKLSNNPVKPVSFRVTNMPLIKQSAVDGHYEWEVIENIPIGITS